MAGSDESQKQKQTPKAVSRIHGNGEQQYIDFTDGLDITGKPKKPAVLYVEPRPPATNAEGGLVVGLDMLIPNDGEDFYSRRAVNPRDPNSDVEDIFLHSGGAQGWAQLIWKQLTNTTTDFTNNFVSSDNVYANNFVINYHSFNAPIPYPLEHFTTFCSFEKSKGGEYEIANLKLKLPYQLALSLFAEDDAQPQPGGYILIKTKPRTDAGEILNTKSDKNVEMAVHFGVVSNLEWEIQPDENGNLVCEISLKVTSFIHNLIHGEYRFSFFNTNDETVRDDQRGNAVREVKHEGYGSDQYYYNIDEYLAFVKREVSAAMGEYDLGTSLRHFLDRFAYPFLPISLQMEPVNAEAIAKVLFDSQTNLEESVAFLKTYIPEPIVNGILNGLADLAQLAGEEMIGFGGNPFTQFYDPTNSVRNNFFKWIKNGFTDPDLQWGTLSGYQYDEVAEAVELRNATKSKPKYSLQLKDIIHVAVKRDDLPPSSSLYGTMPKQVDAIQDLNRIRNLGAKSLTVWGLLQGTFQIDNQLIEFYPVMIPIKDSDIQFFNNNTSIPNPIKLIHRKLGGLPTLILRLKPMHPTVSIDRESIDLEYKRKHLFGSPSPLPPPCYTTTSELLGLNVKDNSFGKLFNSQMALTEFEPDYSRDDPNRTGPTEFRRSMVVKTAGENKAGAVSNVSNDIIQPVQITKNQIISLRFSQNDAQRINATFTNLPGVKNISSRVKYGIMSDPVINNTAALKHGLRMYETTYPYFELSALQAQDQSRAQNLEQFFAAADDNFMDMTRFKTTALAERAYMIYGDEQKYFAGVLQCTSLVTQDVLPGTWIEIFMQEDTGSPIIDQHATLHAYVDQIEHDYFVEPFDGNVVVRSVVRFSRGSYGATIPNFPTTRTAIADFRTPAQRRSRQAGTTPQRAVEQAIGSPIIQALIDNDPAYAPRRVRNPLEPDLPAGQSAKDTKTNTIKTVKLTKEFLERMKDTGIISYTDYLYLDSVGKVPQDTYQELADLLEQAEGLEIEEDQLTSSSEESYDFSDLYEQSEANRAADSSKEGSASNAETVSKEAKRKREQNSGNAVPDETTEDTKRVKRTEVKAKPNKDGNVPIDPETDVKQNRNETNTNQADAQAEIEEE